MALEVVIGIGGGKTLDTAKITAFNIGARIVTVPTIASTDSPTSSIGVIYTADGVYDRVVRCGRNPDVVLIDSAVIVQAPVRFLAAGIGDAFQLGSKHVQIWKAAPRTTLVMAMPPRWQAHKSPASATMC